MFLLFRVPSNITYRKSGFLLLKVKRGPHNKTDGRTPSFQFKVLFKDASTRKGLALAAVKGG